MKTLFVVKIKIFAKILKITRMRKTILKNIKIKITNIFKSIVVEHQCDKNINFIKHIDNKKLQQL